MLVASRVASIMSAQLLMHGLSSSLGYVELSQQNRSFHNILSNLHAVPRCNPAAGDPPRPSFSRMQRVVRGLRYLEAAQTRVVSILLLLVFLSCLLVEARIYLFWTTLLIDVF